MSAGRTAATRWPSFPRTERRLGRLKRPRRAAPRNRRAAPPSVRAPRPAGSGRSVRSASIATGARPRSTRSAAGRVDHPVMIAPDEQHRAGDRGRGRTGRAARRSPGGRCRGSGPRRACVRQMASERGDAPRRRPRRAGEGQPPVEAADDPADDHLRHRHGARQQPSQQRLALDHREPARHRQAAPERPGRSRRAAGSRSCAARRVTQPPSEFPQRTTSPPASARPRPGPPQRRRRSSWGRIGASRSSRAAWPKPGMSWRARAWPRPRHLRPAGGASSRPNRRSREEQDARAADVPLGSSSSTPRPEGPELDALLADDRQPGAIVARSEDAARRSPDRTPTRGR